MLWTARPRIGTSMSAAAACEGRHLDAGIFLGRLDRGRKDAYEYVTSTYILFPGNTILVVHWLSHGRDLQPLKPGNLEPNRCRPCP